MRVVDRLSPPMRGVLAVCSLLGGLAIAAMIVAPADPPRGRHVAGCRWVRPPPSLDTHIAPSPNAVHAKLKHAGAHLVSLHGAAVQPRSLFTHLTTHDERA